MNNIIPPKIHDSAKLWNLANNKRVNNHQKLKAHLIGLMQRYDQYILAKGNALKISPNSPPHPIADVLKKYYKSPSKDIFYIKKLREETSNQPCPMCGSLHSGSLDHLLPKEDFPEFSIYSLNLVPACKCNSIKGRTFIGRPNSNERILHPYFDKCLSNRLMNAHITDLGWVPKIEVQLSVPSSHPEYDAINFHFQTIIKKTTIKRFLRDQWSKFCRKPHLIVRALETNPTSHYDLVQTLKAELALLDEYHNSKNNWESIFVTGLLTADVSLWVYSQMVNSARSPGDPLIA